MRRFASWRLCRSQCARRPAHALAGEEFCVPAAAALLRAGGAERGPKRGLQGSVRVPPLPCSCVGGVCWSDAIEQGSLACWQT
eukprot:6207162-Pleurochrysis_carterae.AAC.1